MPPPRSDWRSRLMRAWQIRGGLARLLWPVSRVYASLLCSQRRKGLLDRERLPVPVVVVGNVVLGGAGKTPTVIALVRHLQTHGWTPGVISRGHGRSGSACQLVSADSTGAEVGDEPALIARATQVPMAVGRLRMDAARLLLQSHPTIDIIVSDDGMQHWALPRDLTVVVFDERGVGNGWLLPAGMLREPWPAQATDDETFLVLRTRRDHAGDLPPLSSPFPAFEAGRRLANLAYDAQGAPQDWRHWADTQPQVRWGALAGIAQPQVFFDMLRAEGLCVQIERSLPDHASGTSLLDTLTPGTHWLCTEKDAVKLFPLLQNRSDLSVWAVPLEQTPAPSFFEAVDRVLDGLSSKHGRQTP